MRKLRGGGGGSDEAIFYFSCMMGPGRSSMMAHRPHDTAASIGAWSEWKRTLSSITVEEERGRGRMKRGEGGQRERQVPLWKPKGRETYNPACLL